MLNTKRIEVWRYFSYLLWNSWLYHLKGWLWMREQRRHPVQHVQVGGYHIAWQLDL
jgi:hypothetical protein